MWKSHDDLWSLKPTLLIAGTGMPPQLCFPNTSSPSPHRKEKAPKAPVNNPQHIYIFSYTHRYFLFRHAVTDHITSCHIRNALDVWQGGCFFVAAVYWGTAFFLLSHHLRTHTHLHKHTHTQGQARTVSQTGIHESNSAKQGFNFGHLCFRGRETYFTALDLTF